MSPSGLMKYNCDSRAASAWVIPHNCIHLRSPHSLAPSMTPPFS